MENSIHTTGNLSPAAGTGDIHETCRDFFDNGDIKTEEMHSSQISNGDAHDNHNSSDSYSHSVIIRHAVFNISIIFAKDAHERKDHEGMMDEEPKHADAKSNN
ncbi:MAG: hypothetical protein K2M69_06015 [Muribaculaceae bacterium]|nr:hypothetical protein [Muribaculaceae bacterium]